MADKDRMMDHGNDPRNEPVSRDNHPIPGGSPPGSTILGPKNRWDPGPIPLRAAQSEADEDIGGTVSKNYSTEM